MNAVGLIEVFGFVNAMKVGDAACKSANVTIVGFDSNKPKAGDDAEIPLVMCVKFSGDVSACMAAIDTAKEVSGEYLICHHIIPRPDVPKMCALTSVGRDVVNDISATTSEALGLMEIQSLAAAITALDAMVKSAEVRLVGVERRLGGRLCTIMIQGSVSAVTAALETGESAANEIGKVCSSANITNPHEEILKFIGGVTV